MTNLHRAVVNIRSIRRQVAQTSEFHGYGPLTLPTTAVFALLAGALQVYWLPDPASHPGQYVGLWLTTAVISAALIAPKRRRGPNRFHSGMADQMIRLGRTAVSSGGCRCAAVPLLVLQVPHSVFWMLPGLWQIIFSLGVFASCRCLPRLMYLVGGWFLLTGLASIARGDTRALGVEVMSLTYAVGMAQVAVIQLFSAKKAFDEDEEL